MNFLKKGPDLKFSDLKVPGFAYDLYYDLRERHLLPLVAILIAAIIAMPIILKSKHPDPEGGVVTAGTATASSAGERDLVVSHSTPGLRDPRTRLKHDHPLDPFSAKGSPAPSEASGESSEEPAAPVEASPTEEPVEATGVDIEAPAEPTDVSGPIGTVESGLTPEAPIRRPSGRPDENRGPIRTRYASSSIDVRMVSIPAQSKTRHNKADIEVRRNLAELTMLPSRPTPAVTFVGASRDGKKALLVVSSDVVSIFGEGTCVIGSQSCQLLALEPQMPVTFVYGPQERRFRIEILKIDKSLSAKPRRAALGTTKVGKSSGPSAPTGSEEATAHPTARGDEPVAG